MNAKYYALCKEYYEKVGKKIEKGNVTTEQAKKLFDNFMLKIVPDYFEEEEKDIANCDLELAYRKEVVYWVDNYNDNEDNKISLNDEEVKEVAFAMLNDDQLNIELDNTIQYHIEQKFSEKFKNGVE